jgi:hypothetical protein
MMIAPGCRIAWPSLGGGEARRLEERDARIREFAPTYHPFQSGHRAAAVIAVELQRYAASGFRFEKDDLAMPADPRCGLLWRILHLSAGKNLSARRVRFALAGVVVVAAGPKTSPKRPTEQVRHLGLDETGNEAAC